MNIEDLLADESFISYCKNDNYEDILRWEAYIRENPEQQLLVETAKQAYLDLYCALALNDREEQEAMLVSRLTQSEGPHIVPMTESGGNKTGKLVSIVLKLAGSVAAVLLLGYLFLDKQEVKNTIPSKSFEATYGERKNFQLPDGSIVILNAGSHVQINGTYGISSRDIFLEGEAFFDVKHNKELPFIVHTTAMDIKALGTAFNVKAYTGEGKTETSLLRGRVEITLNQENGRKLILQPNQKIHWEKETAEIHQASTGNSKKLKDTTDHWVTPLEKTEMGDLKEVGWIDNKLIFNDDALQDIAVLLERWYGIKVEFGDDAIKHYRFTGTFEKESLEMVLDVLKESRKFHYDVVPGNITTIKIVK
ncbi:FecR family protein [Flavihumibacter fluvii]|uniref:FecR family protein n=1 Tax=Flavihumibacter fluvii TaxID=2838157 RepID=UPI001BDED055|nr:FecR domain-containing protein [Flavihumibacter fluvii]ULQ53259.1 DUF4974 domain-containing protein [Flavihumibacter fluvii]